MKKLLPLLLLFLLLPALAFGAATTAKKTPRPCTRCTHPCTTATTTKSSYNALDALVDGFSLTAGFRWDREVTCDPEVATEQHDPFFIGAELRVPLNSWADIGGNVDRDFTEAPNWNTRVFIAAHPWRK